MTLIQLLSKLDKKYSTAGGIMNLAQKGAPVEDDLAAYIYNVLFDTVKDKNNVMLEEMSTIRSEFDEAFKDLINMKIAIGEISMELTCKPTKQK